MNNYSEDKLKVYYNLIEDRVGDKYDRGGIYSISIDNKLVYIGKSAYCKQRLANHLYNMYHPEEREGKAHKYEILRQAANNGHKVNFNLIYESDQKEEMGYKEGELIRNYLPCLNYQIPRADDWHKYTVNKSAKNIQLTDIIGGSLVS